MSKPAQNLVDPKIVDYYTQETVDNIRRSVAKDLTIDELNLFLHNCMASKLDPLRRQIYAIKRKSSTSPGGSMSIQTSIDGFRLIAERTGKYSPGKDTEYSYDDSKKLSGAKAYVKKMTQDGTWHDISAIALLREYDGGRGLWKKMPHVMLEKCAEARALRRAFPDDLSGLYTSDEMEQVEMEELESEVSKEPVDPILDDDTFTRLNDFVNGHENLRDKLKKLCKVDNLRNIKQSQLEACSKYAKNYILQKKSEGRETSEKCKDEEKSA